MATVVITGASGMLGRHIAAALQERGDSVRAFSLRGPVDATMLAGADAVVNLAGEPLPGRWTDAKRAAIIGSRRDGTHALVEAMRGLDERPRVLVSASAVGYYGDRGDEVLTEASPAGRGFASDVCVAWEAAADEALEAGIRVAHLRFGVVLAPDAEAYLRMLRPAKLGAFGPMGSGRQWWSWIHIDDVTGLALCAIDDDRYAGALNAAAPEPLRQREVARTFGRVLRRPSFLPAPAFALRALLGGFASELLDSHRVMPERAGALGYRFRHPGLEGALRALSG
jgi:uncharacterized protein (TIGR01777 family)